MSNAWNEFRQAAKQLLNANDSRYQARPSEKMVADVTNVNVDAGTITIQAQGQPTTVYVGANAALHTAGDQLLVQRTNTDDTHPTYDVLAPVKMDKIRTTFADPNPSLAAPAGFSVTSGTQQPTPGGYTAYADVSLHTVTSTYNYYADGVTYFLVYLKLSTNLAWGAPSIIDLPATRPTGTLAAGITSGATSLTLTLAAGDTPPYRGRVQIEGERIDYTSLSIAGSTYTLSGLTRGADGTTAVSHAAGTAVLFHSVFGRIEGLAINRGYDFKVAAVKAGWIGPYSDVVSLTTAIDTTPPGTPTGLSATLQRSGAQAAWLPVGDADVGVGGYYVVYRNTSASTSGATSHQVSATSYLWGNNDGSGWYFGVQAVDSADNASGVAWAQDTTPPSAPSGLNVTNQQGGVHLAVTASADQSTVGYIWYKAVNATGGSYQEIGRTQGDSVTFDYTMTQGTSSYFNVVGYDLAGQTSDWASKSGALPNFLPGTSLYMNQANYLRNGDMLKGTSNWQAVSDYTKLIGTSYGLYYGVTGESTNGIGPADMPGVAALHYSVTSASGTGTAFYQDILVKAAPELQPGNSYSFSVYASQDLVSGATQVFQYKIQYLNDAYSVLSSTSATLLTAGNYQSGGAFSGNSAAWVRNSLTNQTIPSGTAIVRVVILNSSVPATGTCHIFLTGVQLEPGKTVNKWTPFRENTTETHQTYNLLTNTWQANTTNWTAGSVSWVAAASLPATVPIDVKGGVTSSAGGGNIVANAGVLSITAGWKRGNYYTASVWLYHPTGTGTPNVLAIEGFATIAQNIQPLTGSAGWSRVTLSVLLDESTDGVALTMRVTFGASGCYAIAPQLERGNAGTEFKIAPVDLESAQTVTGVKTFSANPVFNTGTWTPRFEGTTTAGTFTYSQQTGYYTRIGNVVFAQCYLGISAISVAPTGTQIIVRGLPFTVKSQTNGNAAASIGYLHNFNLSTSSLGLTAVGIQNSTDIYLYEYFDNAAAGFFPASQFTNANAAMMLSIVYQV